MRIEPAPSLPICNGPIPAAPPPRRRRCCRPGVRDRSHGLRVIPVSGLSPNAFQPNSGVVVLPRITVPASRSRATPAQSSGQSWSRIDEMRAAQGRETPHQALKSLIVAGTPSSGPIGSPRRQRSSEACAAASAPSRSTTQKALSLAAMRRAGRTAIGSPRPATTSACGRGRARNRRGVSNIVWAGHASSALDLIASAARGGGNSRPSFCIVVPDTDGVSSREQHAEQGTHDFFNANIAMGDSGSFLCRLFCPFDRVDPERSTKDFAVHSAGRPAHS